MTARTDVRPGLAGSVTTTVLRLIGFGLLGANAGIHAYLWDSGYRTIHVIGVLFLLDVVGASVAALAVLAAPRRWLPLVAAGGALFELGTVAGLIVSTRSSLFGFVESTRATLYWQSAITEIGGTVVLAALAVVSLRAGRGTRTAWW